VAVVEIIHPLAERGARHQIKGIFFLDFESLDTRTGRHGLVPYLGPFTGGLCSTAGYENNNIVKKKKPGLTDQTGLFESELTFTRPW
jgi:hypothetical protein